MVEAVDKYFELLTRFPFELKKHPGSKPIRWGVMTGLYLINQDQRLASLLNYTVYRMPFRQI